MNSGFGSAYRDSKGGELANVQGLREVRADSANPGRRQAYHGTWVPARR